MSTSEILKTEELAQMLGCSVTTIEERARKGDLPGLKFGDGGWVFPKEALLQRLNEKAREVARLTRDSARPPTAVYQTGDRQRPKRPTLPSI